jgi:hypothetical protein
MSEQPVGKLQWGQSAAYDAIDDRAVIAAVTRNRVGLIWPPTVRAGTGMNIILEAGWLGVASCQDHTSAVVGSRLDQVIPAIPGPATASREDWLWCDTEPDSGLWSLRVIPRVEAVGRTGIPIAYITAPANATQATQLTIIPVNANLERRLLGYQERNDARVATGNTWSTADTIVWTECIVEPGQWYRVRFTATSMAAVTGSLEGRIGIGRRLTGGTEASSVLMRAAGVSYPRLNAANRGDVEHLFRHPRTEQPINYTYIGRVWCVGNGSYRPNLITNEGFPNVGLELSVEDIGS